MECRATFLGTINPSRRFEGFFADFDYAEITSFVFELNLWLILKLPS